MNFFIFPEYEINDQREIPFVEYSYKDELITRINEYAREKNLIVVDIQDVNAIMRSRGIFSRLFC